MHVQYKHLEPSASMQYYASLGAPEFLHTGWLCHYFPSWWSWEGNQECSACVQPSVHSSFCLWFLIIWKKKQWLNSCTSASLFLVSPQKWFNSLLRHPHIRATGNWKHLPMWEIDLWPFPENDELQLTGTAFTDDMITVKLLSNSWQHQGPLLRTLINLNPSMDK